MLLREILLNCLDWAARVAHEHILGKMKIFENLINVVTSRWYDSPPNIFLL
jgi:hypothetical protein